MTGCGQKDHVTHLKLKPETAKSSDRKWLAPEFRQNSHERNLEYVSQSGVALQRQNFWPKFNTILLIEVTTSPHNSKE
jgi:hypothetical protein